MKTICAWTFLLHAVLSNASTDAQALGHTEINSDEVQTDTTHISTAARSASQPDFEGPSDSSTAARKRDEIPPGTQLYVAWATDMRNDTQTTATRKWLEGIVKDKSKIREKVGFPWTPEEVPNDELQKLYDEGRWDEDIGKLA
jgi:hypothetical protein